MKINDFLLVIKKNCLNKKIWAIQGDEDSTGSIFTFEVGEKINYFDYNNEVKMEGQASFMIYSSWRFRKNNILITSWKEKKLFDNENLLLIDNLKIIDVFMNDMFDLSVYFEKGYALDIFCDDKIENYPHSNWFFRIDKTYYSFDENNKLVIETF